jgi:Holliday junction resolvase RusA-like endonuclease
MDIDQMKGFFPSRLFFRVRVHHLHRFINSSYFQKKTVYIVRDGRDAFVSRYFTMINQKSQERMKSDFIKFSNLIPKEENIKHVLPIYIKFLIQYEKSSTDYKSHFLRSKSHKLFSIKYEDLHSDTENTLKTVLHYLDPRIIIDDEIISNAVLKSSLKSSIKNLKNDTGFFRKDGGKKGDWLNYFTLESAKAFDDYAGDILIQLGYEKDHNWVNQFS